MRIGQLLEFNINNHIIRGKFISQQEDITTIEVVFDS